MQYPLKLEHAYDSSHLPDVQVPLNAHELGDLLNLVSNSLETLRTEFPDRIDEISDERVLEVKLMHFAKEAETKMRVVEKFVDATMSFELLASRQTMPNFKTMHDIEVPFNEFELGYLLSFVGDHIEDIRDELPPTHYDITYYGELFAKLSKFEDLAKENVESNVETNSK